MWPIWELVMMAVVAFISVIPFRSKNGAARWPLLLPILSLILWVIYEFDLKARYPSSDPVIRIDLAIVPLIFLVSCIGVIAWQIVLRREERNKRNPKQMQNIVATAPNFDLMRSAGTKGWSNESEMHVRSA